MSLILEDKQITQSIPVGFICNYCKKKVLESDTYEFQEMFYYRNTGGYGSPFGDMSQYEIILCKDCAYKILSPYTEYINEMLYELS